MSARECPCRRLPAGAVSGALRPAARAAARRASRRRPPAAGAPRRRERRRVRRARQPRAHGAVAGGAGRRLHAGHLHHRRHAAAERARRNDRYLAYLSQAVAESKRYDGPAALARHRARAHEAAPQRSGAGAEGCRQARAPHAAGGGAGSQVRRGQVLPQGTAVLQEPRPAVGSPGEQPQLRRAHRRPGRAGTTSAPACARTTSSS